MNRVDSMNRGMSGLSALESVDIPSLEGKVSDDEWAIRVDLAAAYRMVASYGWDDLIFTHLSARIPGPEHHFVLNPYQLMFEEVTASSLIKVDVHGNPVEPTPFITNPAGFTIHSAIHMAREDAQAVMHLHTPAGQAGAASGDGGCRRQGANTGRWRSALRARRGSDAGPRRRLRDAGPRLGLCAGGGRATGRRARAQADRCRNAGGLGADRPSVDRRSRERNARPNLSGRGERIRTSGPCLPKTVLYQAELLPDRNPRGDRPSRREPRPRLDRGGLPAAQPAINAPARSANPRHGRIFRAESRAGRERSRSARSCASRHSRSPSRRGWRAAT